MMVQCITCASFSLQRAHPDMARAGFGHCEHRETFIVHSSVQNRDCPKHKADDDKTINARKRFLTEVDRA